MDNKEMVINIILTRWANNISISDVAAEDAITSILRHRLNITIPEVSAVVPDHLLMYCSICSCGNPGSAQILLKNILVGNKERIRQAMKLKVMLRSDAIEPSLEDFKYPIFTNPNVKNKYKRLWDRQKINGQNLCDTREFWTEILK